VDYEEVKNQLRTDREGRSTVDYEEVKNQLLSNPKVREAYEENPPLSVAMAQQVVERRKELGMTQLQLADKMGTSQAQVWRIESGHFNPTAKTLTRLERALNFSFGHHFQNFPRVSQVPPIEQLEEWRNAGILVISDEDFEQLELEEDDLEELRELVEKIQLMEWGEKKNIQITAKIEQDNVDNKQGEESKALTFHRR
jgi:transcriptional regulator with XRE-family HTH domain